MGLSIGLGSNAGAGAGTGGGSGAGGMTDILKTGIITSYYLSNVSFGEVEEIPEADWSCYIPNGSVNFPSAWQTSVKKIGSIHNWKSNYLYNLFYNFTALENGPEVIKVGNPGGASMGTLEGMFMRCSKLKNAPKLIQHDNFTDGNISYIFSTCKSLKSIETEWVLSHPVVKASGAFNYCDNLEVLNLPQPFAPTSMQNCFRYDYKLKTINGIIDITNINKSDDLDVSGLMFIECNELETAYVKNLSFNIAFRNYKLSHESAVYLLNNTKEGSAITVQFRPTTFSTLTEEEVAAATQRGITITSY